MKPEMIEPLIADRIREARIDAHLTQEELAAKIGTKAPYISRIEKGQTVPGPVVLTKIANACGILVQRFFEEPVSA